MKKKHLKSGFTLIELLVVITIIGVLTSLFVSNMVGVRERAKDARSKSNLNELKTALRLYYNDNQNYPATDALPNPGATFEDGVVYMQEVPFYIDYIQQNNGDGFLVSTELETASDHEICESWSSCNVAGTCTVGTDVTYYVCAN